MSFVFMDIAILISTRVAIETVSPRWFVFIYIRVRMAAFWIFDYWDYWSGLTCLANLADAFMFLRD
jgi:hypothetical protein